MDKLRFSAGNAKLRDGATLVFSLPAGHTCPGARECRSLVHPEGGHLVNGPHTLYQCSAASEELRYPNVRNSRWGNYDHLLNTEETKDLATVLGSSIDAYQGVEFVRIHASGDFYSEEYFLAWMDAAKTRPDIVFYAYTKSLLFWVNNMERVPSNMILTASYGGLYDSLIEKHNLKNVVVIFHPEEAGDLPIDHDDSHARVPSIPFALLLHGLQPKGSDAATAKRRLRDEGINASYPRMKKKKVKV